MGEHKHASTPWAEAGGTDFRDATGELVGMTNPTRKDAKHLRAHIVKAVNCHDDLVNALKAARPFLAISDDDRAHERLKLVEAAIAKAEGSSK